MKVEQQEDNSRKNALKQVLERRQTYSLPSNFSYRMMERVHLEAEKQKKRRASISWLALLTSVFSLVGMVVYFLFFYLDIHFADYLPQVDIRQSFFLFEFYGYIALLVLILLGVDYWVRKKYIWK